MDHLHGQQEGSWSWKSAGMCFGQPSNDYQELGNVVDWSKGGYQPAVDAWSQQFEPPQPDVVQLSVGRHAGRCRTVDPYFEWAVAHPGKDNRPTSPSRDYRSVSPSVLRWKQWISAGLSWRRRISSRLGNDYR